MLNRKLRIYRGRRERRGEEREAEAEGAGSPAGQGGGGRPGGAGAAQGGWGDWLHVSPGRPRCVPRTFVRAPGDARRREDPSRPLGLPRSRVGGGGPLPQRPYNAFVCVWGQGLFRLRRAPRERAPQRGGCSPPAPNQSVLPSERSAVGMHPAPLPRGSHSPPECRGGINSLI